MGLLIGVKCSSLVVPRAKRNVFKFSFFLRTNNEWNSLYVNIVITTSVDSVKSKLIGFNIPAY